MGGGEWQEGCGIRWFGEWVGGGRLTAGGGEVAGRACPAPTGGGRVSGCWPGTGRRRGQDPSLRCGRLEGGYGKVCGPGMPGPYGVARD